jgi:hypothetical protein
MILEEIAERENTGAPGHGKAMVVVGELHGGLRPGLSNSVNTRNDVLIRFGFRSKNRSNANQKSLSSVLSGV